MKDSPEDGIVNAILDAISEQRLPAGTKLGEQALSDLFSCNRANVRRALASLAAQKVVELRPNRGAYVMMPSPKEARDIFQARRAIESTIARHAAGKASTEDITFLRNNIAEEAAAHRAGDKPAELRASRLFHMRIAQIAGNQVLEHFLAELTMRSTLILGLYCASGRSSCAGDEHDLIVNALEANSTEELVKLVDTHLRHLEAGLNFDDVPESPMSLKEQLLPKQQASSGT